MTTPEGAVARGVLRATRRHDHLRLGPRTLRTTSLLEAALATLPTDQGAPWFTASGAWVGLQYGHQVSSPFVPPPFSARPQVTASYAVPAAVARTVWPLLAVHGEVPRGALDVTTTAMDAAMRAQLCPGCGGHVVLSVRAGGAGARAGLKAHDVIVSIDDVPIAIGATLQDALLPHRPKDTVTLHVLREGKRVALDITLGTRTQRLTARDRRK